MEGSNLSFLIQSQASYHWTNPQRGGGPSTLALPGQGQRKDVTVNPMVLTGQNGVKTCVYLSASTPMRRARWGNLTSPTVCNKIGVPRASLG